MSLKLLKNSYYKSRRVSLKSNNNHNPSDKGSIITEVTVSDEVVEVDKIIGWGLIF